MKIYTTLKYLLLINLYAARKMCLILKYIPLSVRVVIVTSILGFLFLLNLVMVSHVSRSPVIPPAFIPADNAKLVAQQCEEKFNSTFEENLQVIKNYPRGIADKYMNVNQSTPKTMLSYPVIVTAFNYRYYPQNQALLLTIQKLLMPRRKVKVIIYDIGMTKRQVNKLATYCKCEIRKFNLDELPPHVSNLITYAFKPIIVQRMLMEFGFVWWVDSSVRVQTDNMDFAVEYTKENSILYTVSDSPRDEVSIAKQTAVKTFEFLGEDPCKFRPYAEVWATAAMFHFDHVSKTLVDAWAACALNEDCIAPMGTHKTVYHCLEKDNFDGRCHRFDQSVLSILLRRLYHEQNMYPLNDRLNKRLRAFYVIGRGFVVHYFEKCHPIAKCLV